MKPLLFSFFFPSKSPISGQTNPALNPLLPSDAATASWKLTKARQCSPPGATDTTTTDHSIGPSKGARESSDRIARTISSCPVCIFSVGSVAESSISGTGEKAFSLHFTPSLPS
ncbi:hypothetical protein CDAR_68101 [Caerostris darwini]|uniref:Uncharacterized protein n=1 Tax=Caerostris darwini TaxID=1538125 RepID=A0AAV4VT79_9ARAC|nr:hypothetical protein CDAR_68101 [Caerostris darwini]